MTTSFSGAVPPQRIEPSSSRLSSVPKAEVNVAKGGVVHTARAWLALSQALTIATFSGESRRVSGAEAAWAATRCQRLRAAATRLSGSQSISPLPMPAKTA